MRAHRVAFALLILLAGSGPAAADSRTFDFATDKVGAPASGFACARTGRGKEGVWQVVEDEEAGARVRAFAQLDPDATSFRFPVCIATGVAVKDVDLSVRFKPVSGKVDQAAGLVWRYKDADNYYIVRANALEDNVVLYKVEKGRRIDLPLVGKGKTYGAKAPVPRQQWSTLRVTAVGPRFTVLLNGAELYAVEDETFAGAGAIGVWTKADSVTLFRDLKLAVPAAR